MSILEMEQKYGIAIVDDSYWHPLQHRFVKQYRIYTADGCQWENGLSYKSLLKEVKENKEFFLKIKAQKENYVSRETSEEENYVN